ncbi:MAG: LytTR family transcriptional regulator DNA-binding domain-containing protein [Bacteroidales bacterium]|nr:LytTR family transcriptional regulator DNA-binding domain-containing protein [Bacteroidales bacterium]
MYYINILTPEGKEKIDCNQLLYAESNFKFSRLILMNNTINTLSSLQELESKLISQGFFRLNNNYIVNLKYVQLIFPSNSSKLIMENGMAISVDYSKREDLFHCLRKVYELHELV